MAEDNARRYILGNDERNMQIATNDTAAHEPDVDVRCGYGSCKPELLQRFNNPKVLLLIICFFTVSQGFVVNGINNVNTSSIERRFQLSSSKTSLLSSSYDFAAAVFGIGISFYGSGRYKGRWLAIAAVIMGIGSFTMALPHFTTGLYEYGQDVSNACDSNGAETPGLACQDTGLRHYLGLLMAGMMLHGIGGAALYTIGVGYLDDTVSSTESPFYLGCMYGGAALGPGIGYIVGGQLLHVYVDFDKVDTDRNMTAVSLAYSAVARPVSPISLVTVTYGCGWRWYLCIPLEPDDPRWVGAWWAGFFITMTTCLLVAIPLSCFGAEMPTAKTIRETRQSQMHKGDAKSQTSQAHNGQLPIRQMPKIIWLLLSNPPFICTVLAGASEGILSSGFATFIPKLIQNRFHVSAGSAAIYTGLAAVPGAAGGMFFGGFICKKLGLKVRGMLKFAVITCLATILFSTLLWISCDEAAIAGINHPYTAGGSVGSLSASCNTNCSCSTQYYEPVCSGDGVQYFSACFAGCRQTSENNGTFSECACVPVPYSATVSTVTSGGCNSTCGLLFLFLVLFFCVIFFTFLPSTPSDAATLRCIHEDHRTFSMGIKWCIIRLLGTVPGPVIFGAVTDSSCIVWQTQCGENSSCWIYDNADVSRNYFLLAVAAKFSAMIFFSFALYLYKPPVPRESEVVDRRESAKRQMTFVNGSFRASEYEDGVLGASSTIPVMQITNL